MILLLLHSIINTLGMLAIYYFVLNVRFGLPSLVMSKALVTFFILFSSLYSFYKAQQNSDMHV